MSTPPLQQSLERLDAMMRKYWNQPLLAAAGAQADTPLDTLLLQLPAEGAQLGIGGNSFEFVGRHSIDNIQYQFADLDFLTDRDGKVFVTQQDFNAIFVEGDGEGVWGGLAGDDFQCFGRSIAAFVACLADCFELSQAKYADDVSDGDGYKASFIADLRGIVARNEGASFDAWFEYFYG